MKSRKGKIAIGLMIAIAIIAVISITNVALAYTTASRTFALPSSSTVTHTANTYIVTWDRKTGNLVDAGVVDPNNIGVVSSSTTWANAKIDTAVHGQNGLVWTATMPSYDSIYGYALAVFDSASPLKTDVPTMGPFLYDPSSGTVFTDTNPTLGNKTRVIQN